MRVAYEGGGFVEDSWAIAFINTKFRHCKCRAILVYNETWVESIQIYTERAVRVLTSAKHNDPCKNKLPERYTSLYCFVLLYLTTRTILIVSLLQQTLSILFCHSQSSQKDVSARYATTSATKLDPCNIGILVYGIYINIVCSQTYHQWSANANDQEVVSWWGKKKHYVLVMNSKRNKNPRNLGLSLCSRRSNKPIMWWMAFAKQKLTLNDNEKTILLTASTGIIACVIRINLVIMTTILFFFVFYFFIRWPQFYYSTNMRKFTATIFLCYSFARREKVVRWKVHG